LFLSLILVAQATTVTGEALALSWNTGGTLNDSAVGTGLQALHGETWVEWTYAGTAWQVWSLEYTVDGQDRSVYANSAAGTTAFVLDSEEIDADGRIGMRWTYATPELTIIKTETFEAAGTAVAVTFQIENQSRSEVGLLRLLYGLDPDPEVIATGSYNTAMDVVDLDADGVEDYTEAVAPSLGYSFGLGGCDPATLILGAWNDWQYANDADAPLSDFEGTSADAAIGALWWPEGSLGVGRSTSFTLVFALGDTSGEAERAFSDELARACCDADLDGVASPACGGDDCDDTDPSVAPGKVDEPYDGVDADCAGGDDMDQDGDGEAGVEGGGLDCDDTDAAVRSGSPEVWYDGVDQNCDGNDDDQDYDGYPLAYDCDDTDAERFKGCPSGVDDGVVSAGECGCGTSSAAAPGALVLAGLALGWRRRRSD
jgi:MYXO-CTERM domain-containing protein